MVRITFNLSVIQKISFLFMGMWLGRQNLSDPEIRKKLLGYSLGIFIFAEGLSWLLIRIFIEFSSNEMETEAIKAIFGTAPMPPTPLYLLSAGGMAVIIITLSVALTRRFPTSPWIQPFIATGQLALTLYVAHVVLGMGLLETVGLLENQTLPFAVGSALVFYVIGVIFSVFWRKRFKQGPLELIMRRVSN